MTIGTIQNKERFLDRLSAKLNRPRPEKLQLPEWSCAPQLRALAEKTADELVDVLTRQCEAIHTEAVRTTRNKLSGTIEQFLLGQGHQRIVVANEPAFAAYGLTGLLQDTLPEKGVDVHIWDPEAGQKNIDIAEKADAGITFSDMTLAESGTVVLFGNKHKARSVSLLPASYIAIIPKSSIVPRLTQAAAEIRRRAERGERLASNIHFISGPSNSADIEMNLVIGVHGPVKVTYMIVMDG